MKTDRNKEKRIREQFAETLEKEHAELIKKSYWLSKKLSCYDMCDYDEDIRLSEAHYSSFIKDCFARICHSYHNHGGR